MGARTGSSIAPSSFVGVPTLMTAGHPHTPGYITQRVPSSLVTPSARAYGSGVRLIRSLSGL
jgi:adenylate cyclase